MAVAGRKSLRKPGERSAEGPDGAVENLTAGGEVLTAPGSGNGTKGPESEQVAWKNQARWRGSGSDGAGENLTAGGEILTPASSGNGTTVPEAGAFQGGGGGVRENAKKGCLKCSSVPWAKMAHMANDKWQTWRSRASRDERRMPGSGRGACARRGEKWGPKCSSVPQAMVPRVCCTFLSVQAKKAKCSSVQQPMVPGVF